MVSSPTMRNLLYLLVEELIYQNIIITLITIIITRRNRNVRRCGLTWNMIYKFPGQVRLLNRLFSVRDIECLNNLRMDRSTFARLCYLLRERGGLKDHRYVCVEEKVSIFLSVLAHHKKNRAVQFDFRCSGQIVSHYMHLVLKVILKLHHLFLVRPTPIPEDETNPRWKWFKGCLGDLDGTYIDVQVVSSEKPRYRTRKGRVSTNVLGVCDINMRFVYVLLGWKGSAADCRVLRDAISKPDGFKISKGNYYLCDNGYPNSEGFLVPYRGTRYHLSEWGSGTSRPSNPREHFNMRHTRASNVIERAFGVLKKRFGILVSPAYYPIKVQVRLIMACFLLHNFIRSVMPIDPLEALIDNSDDDDTNEHDVIDSVESTTEFNNWRDQKALVMWNEWRATL